MNETPALPFTGERFTPECVREIWYEHWHRYAFARSLARGKRVLDAACGEGYGSAVLAAEATAVTGVDIDAQAIAHAQARYAGHANLRFLRSDVTTLPFPDHAFDLESRSKRSSTLRSRSACWPNSRACSLPTACSCCPRPTSTPTAT